MPLLVSAPARVRLDPPSPRDEVETDVSVIDERAGRRHRGLVVEPENSPGADRSEPRQRAVRPQRRAVLDEGVVSVQVQLRVSGQAGDLTARELDRAVAGQSNIAAQDSRRAESRAAGDVEERLVGAGAGEMDLCPYYRATPPSPCPAPRAWRCRRAEMPLLVSAPAMLRIVPPAPPYAVDAQVTAVVEEGGDRIRSRRLEAEAGRIGDRIDRPDRGRSDRIPGGYCDVRACARYASRAPVVRVVPIPPLPPVHVDLLMMRLLTLVAMLCPLWGRENLSGHRNVADEQEPLPETAIMPMTLLLPKARAQRFATIWHRPVAAV